MQTRRHFRGLMPIYGPDVYHLQQVLRKKGRANCMNTVNDINRVCNEIKEMLMSKNLAYGDSALDPVRIFSKANSTEQLLVRIDDKLSRFARGKSYPGDNDINDLIGYLVLLKIAKERNGQA
jgi:hypothetical protein